MRDTHLLICMICLIKQALLFASFGDCKNVFRIPTYIQAVSSVN